MQTLRGGGRLTLEMEPTEMIDVTPEEGGAMVHYVTIAVAFVLIFGGWWLLRVS